MPGKRIVFAFNVGQIPLGMTNLNDLKGQEVLIDGARYKVEEVDAHPVSEDDGSKVPEDFGLMVKALG